jgi:lipoyl(octanoyl) transferase
MEQAIIDCLAAYGLAAQRKEGAPGVYVAGDKIAALGLRVRNGCSYHGLALNVHMDLAPFTWINPCGYSGLRTIQMADFGITETPEEVGERLLDYLARLLPPVREPIPARPQDQHAATRG